MKKSESLYKEARRIEKEENLSQECLKLIPKYSRRYYEPIFGCADIFKSYLCLNCGNEVVRRKLSDNDLEEAHYDVNNWHYRQQLHGCNCAVPELEQICEANDYPE
jgi:hypothetical protein